MLEIKTRSNLTRQESDLLKQTLMAISLYRGDTAGSEFHTGLRNPQNCVPSRSRKQAAPETSPDAASEENRKSSPKILRLILRCPGHGRLSWQVDSPRHYLGRWHRALASSIWHQGSPTRLPCAASPYMGICFWISCCVNASFNFSEPTKVPVLGRKLFIQFDDVVAKLRRHNVADLTRFH